MRRILIVCTANQCRSPMAEGLVRHRIGAEGLASALVVASAGTWAPEERPATAHAVVTLARRGIDIAGHRSREVTADLLGWADLVLVMTDGHRQGLEADFPGERGKLMLISALDAGRWDVADPVGGSLDDYIATADELARLIDAGWGTIVGEAPTGRPRRGN